MPSHQEWLDESIISPLEFKHLESELDCDSPWRFPRAMPKLTWQVSQQGMCIQHEREPVMLIFQAKTSKAYPTRRWEDWLRAVSKVRISDPFIASASDLSEVLGQITDLAFEEEEDQFGLVRPSYHGYKHCMRLLLQLAKDGKLLRPSDVTTDHNGDIRIAWAKGSNEAELVCPSEGSPYIYFSSAETFGTDPDVTAEKIAERARWAMDGK